MAQTLTNERNLLGRQEAIEQELRLLKRMRLIEWGAAALFVVAGLVWKYGLDKGFFLLFIGGALVFLALGHEARRKESLQEHADTESMRGAKEAVARLLDEKLANDHFILNDLRLKVGREKCWIDHLVVAPSGMFVVNTLNWDGKIVGDTGKQAYTWKIRAPGGQVRPARNPVGRALRERRILCNWLKGTNLIWERVFPLVVLANPNADIQVTNAERRVLTPGQAVTLINDFCFEKPVLSNAEVEKLARGLNEQQNKA
ncbi:MAG: NERD domain-containing protein [Opitutae bacterium]|nr:NERD domain-containing protein [Opitutae bacterium]